jgi:hypothetical protein
MINRRLMIVPPAMPSSGRTEQLDEREKKFLRLLLETEWYPSRVAPSSCLRAMTHSCTFGTREQDGGDHDNIP